MLEGLPPNNATHVMRLSCDEATARAVADIIVETFDPATTAAAAFEEAPDTSSWNSGAWAVEVYFGSPPDEANIRGLVAVVAGDSAAQAAAFGELRQRDWVASSLEGLAPVRAGRFLVHGAHGRGTAKANDIAIEIEAALAFRHRASWFDARLSLHAGARRAAAATQPRSSILAPARAFWPSRRPNCSSARYRPAISITVCVTAASANARHNRVPGFVRPVLAKGAAHPRLRQGAPYDLILANILARPLRALAPQIAELTAPRADIILSGLIARDVPGVVGAYRGQGMALLRRLDIDGWVTLLLQRRGGTRDI